MRDQDIRDILLAGEEPVSSGVWSAVAAGLDARVKRVVPVWLWGAVAFAAAAAVAVGVFIWRPSSGSRLEEYSPASPLVAQVVDNSLSGGVVIPSSAQSAPAKGSAPVIATREEASLEAVPTHTINPEALLKQTSRLAMPPSSSYVPTVDDNYLLNTLAWEAQPLPGRDISLLASGNFQASSRAQALSRRGAAAAALQEGVYNPNPETDKPGFPFAVSLGLKWNFAPRWAIGTGISYTNISRSFVADFKDPDDSGYELTQVPVDNMQHWIGVPVNLYFDVVRTPRWRVHALASGQMDYLLANNFMVHGYNLMPWQKKDVSFQWSAGLGAGVEYMITQRIGLYVDPTVRYYFTQAGGADINGLPVHPVRFMLEAGLRFSLGSY